MTSEELIAYKTSLVETRKAIFPKLEAQAVVLGETHEYVTKTLKDGDPDKEARMKAFDDALLGQKALREEITNIETVIEALTLPSFDFGEVQSAIKSLKLSPSIEGGLLSSASVQDQPLGRSVNQLSGDIQEYMVRKGYNTPAALKSLARGRQAEPMKGGGTFTPALTFVIGMGNEGNVDILEDEDLRSDSGLRADLEKYSARKSMFTQHPLAGGQTVLGVGDRYNPEGIFEGNTGGIFEYSIDRALNEMPYAKQGIMDVLKFQNIKGNSHHFIRQTLRINNAKALLESITAPPANYAQVKPANEYGWTLFKTYVMTYAATVILTDEFAEDVQPIVDAIRDQLGIDVNMAFAQSLATGVNTILNADITGLFNLAGINTRIHRGASAYVAPLTGTPSPFAATDDYRITFERAVLDLRRFGFSPDYILTSYAIQDAMTFQLDQYGKKRYSEAELGKILGATVTAGQEVPDTKAMVGDFGMAVRGLNRTALVIDMGYVNDQFVRDQFTLRGRRRGGLKAMRPYALEKITFA